MTGSKTAAVVLAAGSGSRMRSTVKKQYIELGGRPLIYYALKAFQESEVETIVLVTSPGDEEYCRKNIVERYGLHKVKHITEGGAERYHSVLQGLRQLSGCKTVLIHDGARPFVTQEIIQRAVEGAEKYDACVVGMPVKDTIKISDGDGYAACTPERSNVWMVQTPQAFSYELIREAYEQLMKQSVINVTDDAMVVEQRTGRKVRLIEGSYHNIKVTTPEDLEIAQVFLRERNR